MQHLPARKSRRARLFSSLWAFLWFALRPGGKAATIGLDLLGLGAFPAALWFFGRSLPWVIAGLALGLFFLSLIAGVRLQLEKDRRSRWSVVCEPQVENPGGQTWLYVKVTNGGRTTSISAGIPTVTGVPWPNYSVPLLVWRNTGRSDTSVEAGGTRFLDLAIIGHVPRFLSFKTSDNPVGPGQGWGWGIPDGEAGRVAFRLVITNSGGDDEKSEWDGSLFIPTDPANISFEITPVQPTT